jgi:hypothetical protein
MSTLNLKPEISEQKNYPPIGNVGASQSEKNVTARKTNNIINSNNDKTPIKS